MPDQPMRYVTSPNFVVHLSRPNPHGRYARTLCGREVRSARRPCGREVRSARRPSPYAGWTVSDETLTGHAVECRVCARRKIPTTRRPHE